MTDGTNTVWYSDKLYWWTTQMQKFKGKTVTVYEFYTNATNTPTNAYVANANDRFLALPEPVYTIQVKKDVYKRQTINYATTQNYVGATICKAFFDKVTDFNKKYNNINFTDYVLLHVHNTYDGKLRPLFELEVNDNNVSFIGGSTYLIIKGNFLFMDRESEMYIMQGYSNKNDDFNPDNLYIDCKLKYGSMYWNGSRWTTTDSTFKLYFDNQGQSDHCINRIFPVKNNITWNMGIDGEGYAIPMPNTNEVITGKPTFTLYHPHKVDNSYRCDAVWLSDFDIQAKVQNFQKEEEKDSDTEYSNIINEDFVNEMDSEEFAICTWDNKECNYSAVCYSADSTSFTYLDNVYNKATKQMYRLEEHLIYRLVTQYNTCLLYTSRCV